MSFQATTSMEDGAAIEQLLSSPELASVETAVAQAVDLPVMAVGSRFQQVLEFQRKLHFLGLNCFAVKAGLRKNRERFVRFGICLERSSDGGHDDGEFAPGKNPARTSDRDS